MNLETPKISIINNAARNAGNNIWKLGPDYVKNMFREGTSFQESIKYDRGYEYIKKMVISQMDIRHMLYAHKYYYDYKNPEFDEEYKRIQRPILDDENLHFDEETIDALFGNTYGIKTDDGYKILEQISNPYTVGKIAQIYSEEKFKYDYENEKSKIKRFFMSFKYKKLFPEDVIEEKDVTATRKIFRNFINDNPGVSEDIILYARQPGGSLYKGMNEYETLKEGQIIAATIIRSLEQTQCLEPINLEGTLFRTRGVLKLSNQYKYYSDYRYNNKIGYKDIAEGKYAEHNLFPYKEIKSKIAEFQKRFDEIFLTSETNEEYISGVSGLFVDFLDLHPYQNGNKVTAICLLNNMLLSKGIIPPPINLANDDKLAEAFAKKGKRRYNAVEKIISNGCKKMEEVWGEGKETTERDQAKTVENENSR